MLILYVGVNLTNLTATIAARSRKVGPISAMLAFLTSVFFGDKFDGGDQSEMQNISQEGNKNRFNFLGNVRFEHKLHKIV